jgi:thermitase
VAATDRDARRANFSNYGRPAGTAAPGVEVVGPFVDHRYAVGWGTSFSTAWVSGQAAILLSAAVGRDQVASRIVTTADDISQANGGRDPGFGRINAFRSIAR